MRHLFLRSFRQLFVASLFASGLPACRTDAEAVCDLKCECEGCSDATVNDCYFEADDKARDADAVGCLDYYDELKACEYNTGYCKSTTEWETSCKAEKDRYDNCRK